MLELTLETSAAGDTRIASWRNVATGGGGKLTADIVSYEGGRHPSQPPWVVRPSGQYIFHPRGPAQPVRGTKPPAPPRPHKPQGFACWGQQ